MTGRRTTKSKSGPNGERVTPVTGLPASPRVESDPCHSCRSDNTYVYCTRDRIRYCKCRRCGHTYTIAGPSAVTLDELETR